MLEDWSWFIVRLSKIFIIDDTYHVLPRDLTDASEEWPGQKRPVLVGQLRRGDVLFFGERDGMTTIFITEVMSDGERMDVAFSTIDANGSSQSFELFKMRLDSIFGFFDSWSAEG